MIIEHHIPCTVGCDSSDGMSIYDNGNNHVAWCGVCRKSKVISMNDSKEEEQETKTSSKTKTRKAITEIENWSTGKADDILDRGIMKRTYERYLVKSNEGKVYFPYFDINNELVGFKIRGKDKGSFHVDGSLHDSTLFGQKLFSKGGQYVTIVEGEFDALAAYELQGSKYTTVSINNGAAAALADCKRNFEWLNSFDNVIVCFDNDEPGNDAATKVAALFAGKSKIVRLTHHKDANDYLKAGDHDKFKAVWWAAEVYTPDGIISGSSLKARLKSTPTKPDATYPWEGLNKLLYGLFKPSLVTVTAGSGLGKSAVMKELLHHLLMTTDDRIGALFLEETVEETATGIMSVNGSIPFHLPNANFTEEQYWQAYDNTMGTDRVFFMEHFGSTAIDNIINRIKYLAKAMGCQYIFLDHISIVVSGLATVGDERKVIDEFMTRLRMLAQECNICLILVSHLKRAEGKGHEEGAVTSANQLRGSGAIYQLSNAVIGLERNGQATDKTERNTTKVRVLKARLGGQTGPACRLFYDVKTGRLSEMTEDEIEDTTL